MLYAIIKGTTIDRAPVRQQAGPQHAVRLHKPIIDNNLMMAELFPIVDNEDTSSVVYSDNLCAGKFPSLEEAKTSVETEPYVTTTVNRLVSFKAVKQISS